MSSRIRPKKPGRLTGRLRRAPWRVSEGAPAPKPPCRSGVSASCGRLKIGPHYILHAKDLGDTPECVGIAATALDEVAQRLKRDIESNCPAVFEALDHGAFR